MAELVWRRLSVATAFMILFWGLVKSDGQCNIQYENKALRYGAMEFLQCPSSVPGPARWWRSTERCDSFVNYSSQCRGPSCGVFANSSYFYYCCTASAVGDVLSARDEERSCFRIQICTDVSINSQGSTVAFFNDKAQIFVEMFAEPQPEQNTAIFLTHSTETQQLMANYTEYEVATVGDARLVWRYIVQVPDLLSKPSEGVLRFTAYFNHSNPRCQQQFVPYSINVRRKDSPMKTEAPTGSEPDMGGLSTLSASELIGYQAGIGVLSSLLVIYFVTSIVIALCCYFRWRKQRSSSSTNPYGVSPGTPMSERPLYDSPGETPMSERPPPPYCREDSSASTTHLLRNNYEPNHPTSLPVGGCNYNGHTLTSDIANTPTPTIQSRLLPSTPDDRLPTPSSTNHMETINEERGVESENQPPFYAYLNENVSLEMQQNNSSAAEV